MHFYDFARHAKKHIARSTPLKAFAQYHAPHYHHSLCLQLTYYLRAGRGIRQKASASGHISLFQRIIKDIFTGLMLPDDYY